MRKTVENTSCGTTYNISNIAPDFGNMKNQLEREVLCNRFNGRNVTQHVARKVIGH